MSKVEPAAGAPTPKDLRRAYQVLIRRFGLLDSNRTPCGQPLAISHSHALMVLQHEPDIRQQALAGTLGLSKSAVSRMVDQLQRRGWLERQVDDNDGRARRLSLSEAGRKLARKIDRTSLALFATILDRIPTSARGQVISTLELLHSAIPTEMDE